jgi:branched-subunit amino acid transport protein
MRYRAGERQEEPIVTWVVVLAVGAGSFVFRLGPLLLLQRISLTGRADRVIRHAGTAAITALIVVSTKSSATGTGAIPTLLAVAAGVVLAARGVSLLRLVVCGGGIYACSLLVVDLLAR